MTSINKNTIITIITMFIVLFCIFVFNGNDIVSCIMGPFLMSSFATWFAHEVAQSNHIIDIDSREIYRQEQYLKIFELYIKYKEKLRLRTDYKKIMRANYLRSELHNMKIDLYFSSLLIEYINNDYDVNKYFYKQYLKNKKNNII